MPTGAGAPKPGLGTGIVEALARQLQGEIRTTDAAPGTAVAIVHDAASIVRKDIEAVGLTVLPESSLLRQPSQDGAVRSVWN